MVVFVSFWLLVFFGVSTWFMCVFCVVGCWGWALARVYCHCGYVGLVVAACGVGRWLVVQCLLVGASF